MMIPFSFVGRWFLLVFVVWILQGIILFQPSSSVGGEGRSSRSHSILLLVQGSEQDDKKVSSDQHHQQQHKAVCDESSSSEEEEECAPLSMAVEDKNNNNNNNNNGEQQQQGQKEETCVNGKNNNNTDEDDELLLPPLVLVTGANGYIGLSLVEMLLQQGYRVRGTVRNITDPKKVQPLKDIQKRILLEQQNNNTTQQQQFEASSSSSSLQLMSLQLNDTSSQYATVVENVHWIFHTAARVDINPLLKDETEQLEWSLYAIRQLLYHASLSTSSVTKVVYTGSVAEVSAGHIIKVQEGHIFTEDDWTIVNSPITKSYQKIKTFTEHAAWEFMEQNSPTKFTLTTLLPSFVIGPVPHHEVSSSTKLVSRLLAGQDPGLIDLYVPVVDIRDVCQGHILAATTPKASGKRFIVSHPNGDVFYPDMATILRNELESFGYSIPQWIIPRWIIWIASWLDNDIAQIYSRLGRRIYYNVTASQTILNLNYTNINQTLIDGAHSMIQHGIVRQTPGYHHHHHHFHPPSSLSSSSSSPP